jgi:hypothetical protein
MVTTGAVEGGCLKLLDTAKQAVFLISTNIPIFRAAGQLMPVIWPKEAKASLM